MPNWNELFEYRDGELYWKIKPCCRMKVGAKAGYLNQNGYYNLTYNRKTHRVHRIVWLIHNDKIPINFQVDHIDGNKKNNKIENLRLATKSGNQANSKKYLHKKRGICFSKYKGVDKRPSGRFRVHIYIAPKVVSIGTFDDEIEAALAYDSSAINLHGLFALTNKMLFPEDFKC
jgi:hypothetical protein